jgi:hypothetical protein
VATLDDIKRRSKALPIKGKSESDARVLYIHTSRLRRKVAKDDGKRRYEQQFYPSRELEVIERPVADNGNGIWNPLLVTGRSKLEQLDS